MTFQISKQTQLYEMQLVKKVCNEHNQWCGSFEAIRALQLCSPYGVVTRLSLLPQINRTNIV
jgi:hypothetical protein